MSDLSELKNAAKEKELPGKLNLLTEKLRRNRQVLEEIKKAVYRIHNQTEPINESTKEKSKEPETVVEILKQCVDSLDENNILAEDIASFFNTLV